MKKCVMIFNAKSGKIKSKETINKIVKTIEKHGYELKILYTKRKGHATKLVSKLKGDVDLVISAGGDGTFHEVIRGNLKRSKKLLLAPLPLGTTNDVGSMYGLDGNVVENLESILNGKVKNIDVCMANNSSFIYILGFGNLLNVSYTTPKKLKEKYGYLAYIVNALKELRGGLKQYNIKYTIDGKEHIGKYTFIFITNSNHVGGFDNIYNDVKLDDNMFEVSFFNIKSKLNLIRDLGLLKIKSIEEIPDCEYYKTNNLKLEFLDDISESWCADGEELKLDSKIINIGVNKEINVLLPTKNIKKLFVDENTD